MYSMTDMTPHPRGRTQTAAGSVPSSPGPEKTGSVDYIVSEILRGLHEGRYVPGQKLQEAELTARLSVGRGTVREALRRLEAEGLTTASLHRGASIRRFTRKGARDVLEVTENLFSFAARLAAERIGSAEEIDALRNILVEMSDQIDRGDGFALSQSRFRFLRQMVSSTNNSELVRALPRCDAVVLRAQFRPAFDLNATREELEHFKAVVISIMARDRAGAEQAIRQFVRRAALAIQQLPDEYFA